MSNELPGIHERFIVTAYNNDGGAFRYMSASKADADNTASIYRDMSLVDISVRRVLWDNRSNSIV